MVVVFFGTPAFAVPTVHLLDRDHVVAGVITQPDKPRGRGQKVTHAPIKAFAVERRIPILQPQRLKDPDVADALRAWQPDIGVVAAYGRIIPEHLLSIPRLGMLNVHASLLPRYRGAAPVHRAVMHGDQETGVTIMRVVKELDAGPMLGKMTRPVGPYETSDVVEEALADLGAGLLGRVLGEIAAGVAREEPQSDALATYAPRLTREEGLIEWAQSAAAIHNRVRGLYPWPHAYTYLHGARLILLRTDPGVAAAGNGPHALPGTILEATRDAIHVATGAGRLAILELQPEGRRPMAIREFVAGHPVGDGAVLGGA